MWRAGAVERGGADGCEGLIIIIHVVTAVLCDRSALVGGAVITDESSVLGCSY